MHGRIYDPTLGRFLQADPHIQAPHNSQNYNRYSYVLNNPLSYTDPSGYFFKSLFKKLNKALGKFAPFVGLGLMLIPGVGQWAAATWYNAAAIGFVSGGIATGSLRGALIGAFSGAAFQQIGGAFDAKSGFWAEGGLGHVSSHAMTGGIISELSGGKFGHGFFAAGLTKALNMNKMIGTAAKDASLRIVSAAVVGGTISKVTGGKFANGAITAGFAQAFNGEQQAERAEATKQRKMYLVAMSDKHPESTPGHVFVGFVDGDGNTQAFGFYPDRENFGTWDMLSENETFSGYVKDDTALFNEALSGNEHYQMKVFSVDQTTYDNAMNYIQSYAGSNDYGLFTNSCVHAAFNTFNSVGLINSTGTPSSVLPRTVYDAIQQGY